MFMKISSDIQLQNYIFELFKDINQDDLDYIYRGNFSPEIVADILSFAKKNLDEASDTAKIRSKIYYVIGEGIQNITRHHEESIIEGEEEWPMVIIHKKLFKYYLSTANLVDSSQHSNLKSRLDKINSLDQDELRDFYRATIMEGKISDKGGAGLGLIEMARRSGNKLLFDFEKINESQSFFYLTTEVPTLPKGSTSPVPEYFLTLDNVKKVHNFLIKENAVMMFKGAFDQRNLLHLLAVIEKNLPEKAISIKIYNIMVEMIQNIVNHAENVEEEKNWKPGIFIINRKNSDFILTTGNYVKEDDIENLKAKLDFVNLLSTTELTEVYNRILMADEKIDPSKVGLGLIDIRKRSGNEIEYFFFKTDSGYHFCGIQVQIKA